MGTRTWDFGEDGQITTELIAMKLLGGGSAYEAWLAFDEITYAPMMVKVVRPDQVADHSASWPPPRGGGLAEVNHPW